VRHASLLNCPRLTGLLDGSSTAVRRRKAP